MKGKYILILLVCLPFVSGATLQGVVMDNLGNLIQDAELKISCDGISDMPTHTDRFGSFSVNISGKKCRVYALHGALTGSASVEIDGPSADVEVRIGRQKSAALIWIAIVVGGTALLWILQRSRETPQEPNMRINAPNLLSVLPVKEREVVMFLREHDGVSVNANIRHALRIPRTTMKRLLTSLEAKKLARLEKRGKAIQVSLSSHAKTGKLEQK